MLDDLPGSAPAVHVPASRWRLDASAPAIDSLAGHWRSLSNAVRGAQGQIDPAARALAAKWPGAPLEQYQG
ncbi:MAG: hypothetical protein LC790_05805, partial [Actinobacteria bacterium]|nr:hypothetical protein [Actinomycetota bacterium]